MTSARTTTILSSPLTVLSSPRALYQMQVSSGQTLSVGERLTVDKRNGCVKRWSAGEAMVGVATQVNNDGTVVVAVIGSDTELVSPPAGTLPLFTKVRVP